MKTVKNYHLVGQLGQGGMGVVYRALDVVSGEELALKTLHACRAGAIRGLRREIRLLGALDHPGIVRLLDHGYEEGRPWYVMPLIEGTSMRWQTQTAQGEETPQPESLTLTTGTGRQTTLRDTPLLSIDLEAPEETHAHVRAAPTRVSWRDQLDAWIQLLRALAYLHAQGIIHLDLKPSNVLLGSSQRPVLIDFGLARSVQGGEGRELIDHAFDFAGTLHYMAPERFTGAGSGLDARADLYAVGCMLYEALAGRRPFEGSTIQQLHNQHCYASPRPPRELNPELPEPLDALILALLDKTPSRRPAYALEIAEQLEGLLDRAAEVETPHGLYYLYPPALIAREDIIARFDALLKTRSDADDVSPTVILIEGESGVGKTTLARALNHHAARAGYDAFGGRCAASGTRHSQQPLHPLRAILSALADRAQERGGDRRHEVFSTEGRWLARIAPELLEYPEIAAQPPPPLTTPDAYEARLCGALQRTLERASASTPLLIVLDDMQWADALTLRWLQRCLSGAVSPLRGASLVLVLLTRPIASQSPLDALKDRAHMRETLPRLDLEGVRQLTTSMLAGSRVSGALIEFLFEHSRGNPFFVAEYLRAARSEGLLERAAGAWRLHPRFGDNTTAILAALNETMPLPTGLRSLVLHQLEGLDPSARRLLDVAAVLGQAFDETQLLELGRRSLTVESGWVNPPSVGLEDINALLRRALFEFDERSRLNFAHDVTREVLIETMCVSDRRALHRLIAESLDASPESIDCLAERARHWASAGERSRAMPLYDAAIDAAEARVEFGFAVQLLETRLTLSEDARVQASLRWRLARFLFRRGQLADALIQAREAATLARQVDDSETGWRARLVEAASMRQQGVVKGALDVLQALEREKAPTPYEEADALSEIGCAFFDQAEFSQAEVYFERALKKMRVVGEPSDVAHILRQFGLIRQRGGAYDEARRFFDEARRALVALGPSRDLGMVLGNLAILDLHHGGPTLQTIEYLRDALAMHREAEDRISQATMLNCLGIAHRAHGRTPLARALFEQSLSLYEASGFRLGCQAICINLALCAIDERDHVEAELALDRAQAFSEQTPNLPVHPSIEALRASLDIERGDFQRAHERFALAETQFVQSGDRVQLALMKIHKARLSRLRGQLAAARALLEEAKKQLEEAHTNFSWRGLVYCERGHLALALDEDPEAALDMARGLALEFRVESTSELALAIDRLERAWREKRSGAALCFGESPRDLSSAARRAISEGS